MGYIHNFGVPSQGGLNTVTIFADPHSSADKRYRGISSPIFQTDNVTYVNHSYSADGLNWTASTEPWTMSGIASGWEASGGADTQLSAFWDPSCAPPMSGSSAAGVQMGCYTLYDRFDKNSPLPKPFFRMVRRNRATSLDAANGQGDWNLYPEEIVMAADTMDNKSHPAENAATPPVDYYGATVWVDRAGMYWMAAVRNWHWDNGPFAWEGKAWKPGGQPLGSYDIALAMSLDGSHFEFLGERRPWAQPSRDGTAGSRRLWLASPGPIPSGSQADADLHVFFTRSNTAELGVGSIDPALAAPEWLSEIVVGTLRTDGLAAIEAPYGTVAVLTTKALTFPRGELILNLDTGGGSGSLVVIVKAAVNGSSLATSTPISANAVDLAVRGWMPGSKSIASLAGTPVTIEFHLSSCLFYSFRFSSGQQQIKTDDNKPTASLERYVDCKHGSDANAGTARKPLKSLRAARDSIRHARRATMAKTSNATIWIYAGTCFSWQSSQQNASLELGPEDSHTEWRVVAGEVSFSGAIPLNASASSALGKDEMVLFTDAVREQIRVVDLSHLSDLGQLRPLSWSSGDACIRADRYVPAAVEMLFVGPSESARRMMRARYPNKHGAPNTSDWADISNASDAELSATIATSAARTESWTKQLASSGELWAHGLWTFSRIVMLSPFVARCPSR
eukprot:COSAG04_NODE_55_length_30619_cov_12.038991_26_plen_678_part_00